MTSEWPVWPPGEEGILLSDLDVDMPINELFLLVHGGDFEFRRKIDELCKFQSCTTAGWHPTLEDALSKPPTQSPLANIDLLDVGFHARRNFSAPSAMGMCQTTEIHRLIECEPGKNIMMQGVVAAVAKYGDKFRPIFKRSLEALSPEKTRMKTWGTVVFIGPVNGFVKGIIQKAANDGTSSSVRNMQTILEQYTTVRPFAVIRVPVSTTVTAAAVPSTPASLPQAGLAAAVAAEISVIERFLKNVAGATTVEALQPWASFLHAAMAHMPYMGGITPEKILAALVFLFSMGVVRLCLAALLFAESAGKSPQDVFSIASHYIFRVIHVPGSFFEVLTTLGIAYLARAVMQKMAARMSAPPSSGTRPPSPENSHLFGTSLLGTSSTTTGAPGAVGEEGEIPSGVKYDGYRQAIGASSSANKNHFGGAGQSPAAVMHALDEESEQVLEHIRNGLLSVGKIVKPAARDARAKVKQQVHRHHPHRVHRHNIHTPGKTNDINITPSDAVGGGGESMSPLADGCAAIVASPRSYPTSPLPLPPPLESHHVARGDAPTSPISANDAYTTTAITATGTTVFTTTVTETAPATEEYHQLSPQGYSGPELPPELRAYAVVESIFENERLQPFRGWGHSWPGHFLPTDKELHWSVMDLNTGSQLAYSQELSKVVPRVPQGWRWVEEEWHLDLNGVFSDSTDNNGWSYGLDFPWVMYPFAPGNGRKKMADFVRRRRWLRTRVPSSVPGAASASVEDDDSSSDSDDEEGTNTTQDSNGGGGGDGGGVGASRSSSGGTESAAAHQINDETTFSPLAAKEELEEEDGEQREHQQLGIDNGSADVLTAAISKEAVSPPSSSSSSSYPSTDGDGGGGGNDAMSDALLQEMAQFVSVADQLLVHKNEPETVTTVEDSIAVPDATTTTTTPITTIVPDATHTTTTAAVVVGAVSSELTPTFDGESKSSVAVAVTEEIKKAAEVDLP